MLIAKDSGGRRTIGYRARRNVDYFCPACGEKVIPRIGRIRIPHFAHIAECVCTYYSGETETHRRMKSFLHDYYSRARYASKVDCEFPLEKVIADVYLEGVNGNRIAIECQVSRIEDRELMKKTVSYSRLGIHVLWILGGRTELDRCIIRLRNAGRAALCYSAGENEKRLQRLYYGRFYYFFNGRIYPIHMEAEERWMSGSCEGCPREMECTPEDRERCGNYSPGFMVRMRKKQQITIGALLSYKPVCIERAGGLKLARFMDKRWWGTTGKG